MITKDFIFYVPNDGQNIPFTKEEDVAIKLFAYHCTDASTKVHFFGSIKEAEFDSLTKESEQIKAILERHGAIFEARAKPFSVS